MVLRLGILPVTKTARPKHPRSGLQGVEPTQAAGKSSAAPRVFAEQAGWHSQRETLIGDRSLARKKDGLAFFVSPLCSLRDLLFNRRTTFNSWATGTEPAPAGQEARTRMTACIGLGSLA